MTTGSPSWVVRGVVGAQLAVSAFGLLLALMYPGADLDMWFILTFAAAQATGIVIALRRPENILGWSFLTLGTMGWLISGLYSNATAAVASGGLSTFDLLSVWLSQSMWMVILLLVALYPLMLFPDGLQSPRWRPVFWLGNGAVAVLVAMAAFTPRLQDESLSLDIDNPVSPSWLSWLPADPENNPVANVAFLVFAGCVLISAVGVVVRYRRASGIELLQLRWFAFAAAAVFVTLVIEQLLPDEWQNSTLANAVTPLAFALLPIAVGIAVTRHGLYEIDRIISRTLAYAVVTGAVIGVYILIVATISRLLSSSSTLAVTIATLCAAALFQPLLRVVRGVVDRRFNRSRYDAQHTVDSFGSRLRREIHADAVSGELVNVVRTSLEPREVTLWVRNG